MQYRARQTAAKVLCVCICLLHYSRTTLLTVHRLTPGLTTHAPFKVMVWKELNYGAMTEREKQMLVSEVNILRELHHPNIVRYYDR